MPETRLKLIRCFATVFPDLSEQAIPLASQSSVEAWDSIASITLINVVEEEFAIAIDLEMLPRLTSFRSFEEHINAHLGNSRVA